MRRACLGPQMDLRCHPKPGCEASVMWLRRKPRLMAMRMLRILLLALLRFYKLAISPFLGDRCRFYPSCSDYARDAIQYHGAARGSYLALKRVCRCHPFSAGGVDPVPASSNFKR